MSDSKDLDSYGDWVKKPPLDIDGENPSEDDMAVDIFDFPDSGEPDLDASALDEQPSSAEDDDTTLSPEELAHITVNQEIMSEDFEDPTIDPAAEALGNVFSEEAKLAENSGENVDEFEIPASMDMDEPLPEEIEVPDAGEFEATEEVSIDAMADGEIDLDSFMDDSGGSSGEISFEDGEIDLDDFMGGDFMGGGGSSSSKAPPEIQDEQTLDINVGFDEDAENIALEDTPENEAKMFPKKEEPARADGDAMFNSFEEAVAADVSSEPAAGGEAFSAEDGEIDLSEFGFDDDDSNIGMTEGPDGNEPVKKDVVDYDVRVVVDDDSKTPPVQDVVNGKIVAEDQNVDSEEDEITEQNELTGGAANSASPEISEKGKEILEDIIGQLASLKDEIKSLKNEFASLSARSANEVPTIDQPAETQEEDMGFFGNDDGDDTIALSGSEMTNILNSAQFSEESAGEDFSAEEEIAEPTIEEPLVEDAIEETSVEESEVLDAAAAEEPALEINENAFAEPTEEPMIAEDKDAFMADDGFGIEDPTLESLSENHENPIPPTILPEEIAVPKGDFAPAAETTEAYSKNAKEEFDALESEDISVEDSLTSEKLKYLNENSAMPEEEEFSAPDVAEIVHENISLQEDKTEASVEIDDDINAAFEEADALESDIIDDSLAAKDDFGNSVSDIMHENISLQEDKTEAAVGIGEDINAAFEEADATESDIIDDSLAAKDAYEKKINELVDDDGDALGLDDEETAAEEQAETEDVTVAEVQEPIIEDSLEETSVEEPVIEEATDEPSLDDGEKTQAAPAQQNSIPKNLREEVISVLSYMDQLLENLPEEKITEFAKSEHFVTYKKLFDELGLS